VEKNPELELVDLSASPSATDRALESLSNCHGLKLLKVSLPHQVCSQIHFSSGKDFKLPRKSLGLLISRCPQLESLSLSGCIGMNGWEDAVINALSFSSLKKLNKVFFHSFSNNFHQKGLSQRRSSEPPNCAIQTRVAIRRKEKRQKERKIQTIGDLPIRVRPFVETQSEERGNQKKD
jgi:hypothetical protein